ncbi:ATP-binding protein [Planctomycetota bacterium]|nr:ATP-binding protein [Planctomycetota bacterium]
MDGPTFHDVVKALLRNALDEAQAGHCESITVEVTHDAVRVGDDGRGLPVHVHPRSGRALIEVILTGPRRGPRNTLAKINGSCMWLEVEVHRDKELWVQRYEFAKPVTSLMKKGTTDERGTTMTCAPAVGEAPGFDDLRELVRTLTEEASVPVKVRIHDRRVAKDETIVVV